MPPAILPTRLSPGSRVVIGSARIELDPDGSFRACDDYGCAEALVTPGVPVEVNPIPAIYRLSASTPFIYVEFDRRVHVGDGERYYWTLAPLELEIVIDGLTLTRLSPVKVKYTLIGDVVEGFISRYYKAVIAREPDKLPWEQGLAILGFKVKGSSALLPGIGFNASIATFYADDKGRLYYPLVEVITDGSLVTARTTSEPPLPGLQRILPEDRRRIFVFVQQAPPFTMTIEVIKRRIIPP
ncbi:MAG: DUF432 domain-containing protein [Pyrodictiaceae archaeon]